MIDYGKAIEELAGITIFLRDLLPKSFGLNRRKKVLLYDYDDIIYNRSFFQKDSAINVL